MEFLQVKILPLIMYCSPSEQLTQGMRLTGVDAAKLLTHLECGFAGPIFSATLRRGLLVHIYRDREHVGGLCTRNKLKERKKKI